MACAPILSGVCQSSVDTTQESGAGLACIEGLLVEHGSESLAPLLPCRFTVN